MKTGTLHHVFYVGRSEFSVLYSHIDDSHSGVFFFLLYRFVLVVGVIFWCERVYPGGGGYSLIFALQTSALPQRVWFLRCFGLKTVVDLSQFGFSFRGNSGVLGRICRLNFK